MTVVIYDTTLRDGTQGEGIQMSVPDKLAVCRLLDELGVAYIEGGYPGGNPRDKEFFKKAKKLNLYQAKLTAFGSTRHATTTCEQDAMLGSLLNTGIPILTVVGKSSRFQATHALRVSEEQNLEMIEDTIRYLKSRVDEVIFDAEHFFDGYLEDSDYALKALRAAQAGGATWLCLCDTNGGILPDQITTIVQEVKGKIDAPLGIHSHNDSEVAVANALTAVRAGATMVQGTINGYGERCGNANLISIIAGLVLKMDIECIPKEKLSMLRHISISVAEFANQVPLTSRPYVGRSAFAHKGGLHSNAISKDSRTYEHIDPDLVGNRRRILISDLAGKTSVALKAREFGINLDPNDPATDAIVKRMKELENYGYQFEGATASFKMVVDEALGQRPKYFELRDLEVSIGIGDEDPDAAWWKGDTIAHLEVEVGGLVVQNTIKGEGPVHAMDVCLRSLIDKFYPTLKTVKLLDYKVRVLNGKQGTDSVVRVLIQSTDGEEVWETVGVSPNIIVASWKAMVDGLEYKLIKDKVEPHQASPETVVDITASSARSHYQRARERERKSTRPLSKKAGRAIDDER